MPILIHNSLTKEKEPFLPLKEPQVNMYTCGVTVYDESHIGHARSLYTFDVMRRYFQYRGFKIKFVRNITDIDDKIINRARELKTDWQELSKRYIESYYEDLRLLNIDRADCEPRATENISEMVKHIEGLIAKGYAYVTASGVYFNVRKFKDYGRLSGQGIDQMVSGLRIEPDETKEDPLDFALWKRSKEDEPFWDSPWGRGRPGWHIECSVMSAKYLGTETLDIHAGGRDLIFPHHENEIAQSEALTGKPFARYWIHHGLLTINGQKMSKSLGNFVTIKDFMNKYKNADFLKLFFLSAHYSHPIDYTQEKIEESRQAIERIRILKGKMDQKLPADQSWKGANEHKQVIDIKDKFIRAMDDDFNTPQALACVFELVTLTNKNIDNLDCIYNARKAMEELLDIFGISFKQLPRSFELQLTEEITVKDEIEIEILKREKARKEKDFALSDKIRKELEGKGIILEDTKDGKTTWRRKL